jgi:pimeloyl-ACP methyl ester carboxylesterase
VARILLVHGAFSNASVWDRVLPGLQAAGHRTEAIDLPGSGSDRTPVAEVTLAAYVERICGALEEGPPAVVVGHSMGGMAISQAAADRPERFTALIYVAAFLPADGQSLMDLTALPEAADDQVQANLVVAGGPPVATLPAEAARLALYGSCDREQLAWGVARLGPQAVAPFLAPLIVEDRNRDAFSALARAYVLCKRDRAIPPELQTLMLSRAGCDRVVELDTDHCPWISRAEELVAVLDRLAAEAREPAGAQ